MIVAGVDEAGYGPRLGPLVVVANAFRAASGTAGEQGEWPSFRPVGRGRLEICDSKRAYSRGKGLAGLEKTVLAFAAHAGWRPGDFEGFLARWAIDGAAEAFSRSWYGGAGLGLPCAIGPEEVSDGAGCVSDWLASGGMTYLGAAVCVVDAVRYNEIVARIGNKATLLFGRASMLMRKLWREHGREGVYLTVDRHGGRKFYRGLLDIAFPEARIEVLGESEDESVYRLSGGGREMLVRFKVAAEHEDAAAALSSMWAKYTRELFMRLFNRYWLARTDAVRATAGYWTDGERFLSDLLAARIVTESEAARFTRVR